jgi:glycosyltransferase involved in cell wall biosynthesis
MKDLLHVQLITYNQVNYIEKAIQSVLAQKTSFPFKLIIGDDASNDGTQDIILKYKKENPDLIECRFNKVNKGSQNPDRIGVKLLRENRSKYVALLDGDDYWSDTCKLQKQIDILISNPSYSGCFHDTYVCEYENELTPFRHYEKVDFGVSDTISKIALLHTSSFIFKRDSFKFPDWYNNIHSADMVIFSVVASTGKIRRIPEFMSVYNKHDAGMTNHIELEDYHKNRILLMNKLNEHFNGQFETHIFKIIEHHEFAIRELNNKNRSKNYFIVLREKLRIRTRIKKMFL